MLSMRDIKGRIKSVREIQHITRAMKMVATAKLKKAERRLEKSRPFLEKAETLIRSFQESATDRDHPLLRGREVRRLGLVLITSDKGLCGAYNHNLTRAGLSFMEDKASKEFHIFALGLRGARFFRRRGVEPREAIGNLSRADIPRVAFALARTLIADFLSGRTDEVIIIYNRYESVSDQGVTVEGILPVKCERKKRADRTAPRYLYEPGWESLLETVLQADVAGRLCRAILQSEVAEHLARMNAMENATNNAGDLIESLVLSFNRARQDAITTEIADIVGGAEALR